jgi:predicted enzyme related to lactoylglutathione lyase
MSQPRTYPAGVPCWVDTEQPDPDAACRFYGELFGWTFEDAVPAQAPARI